MVRLDRRKKEEYVKKRMRKLSDVININDQPRYWKSLFSLAGKKKIKSSGFLGKRRKKGGEGSYDVLVRLESVAAAFLLFLPRCGSHAVTLRAYRVTFRIVGRVT